MISTIKTLQRRRMGKANFFIAGVPKAGTTSLHDTLAEHSQIYMSDPKEVNHFSADEILNENLYYDAEVVSSRSDYERIFEQREELILGESSVSYFSYPSIPSRLSNYNADAKVLIILRNPVQRAFSHYLMDRKLGYCSDNFEELAEQYLNEIENLKTRQYFKLSEYFEPLHRYHKIFNDNLLVCSYDQLLDQPQMVLANIQNFLGVENENLFLASSNRFSEPRASLARAVYQTKSLRSFAKKIFPPSLQRPLKNLFLKTGTKPTIDQNIRLRLENHYRNDLLKVEELIGLNTTLLVR